MSVDAFSINGPALVYIGDAGGDNLELLGYTDQGVDLRVRHNKIPQYTDLFGPYVPQEFLDMGMMGKLSVPLMAFDTTLLDSVLDTGDRLDEGMISTPGLPQGQLGWAFSVGIASDPNIGGPGLPWLFLYCVINPDFSTKLSVRANPFKLELIAWPFRDTSSAGSVQSGLDAELWVRDLPGI